MAPPITLMWITAPATSFSAWQRWSVASISILRRTGEEGGVILDGRDIGTVICPAAALKLFVTASLEARAKRRLKELQSKGIEATYRAVLADMRARDERDSGRKAAPLHPAEDAIVLDTSDLSAEEVLGKALDIVAQVRQKHPAR